MKKTTTLILAFVSLFAGFVQAQNQLKQVFILNEGHYDYVTGNIDVPVTLGTYSPVTKHYTTIEAILGARFATDLVIDGNSLYAAADDKIIKYNKNTFVREGVLPLYGVRKLAIWKNQLLVTRGEYGQVFNSYFQVYDKNSLSFLYELTVNNGPQYACEGVVVSGDSAYIAVNNAFDYPNYKGLIGVVNLNGQSYVREVNMGANGTNPDYMTIVGSNIFTVNNEDYSTASISKYDVNTGAITTTSLATVGGCGTSVYAANDIYYQVAGESQLARFSTANLATYDTLVINKSLYGMGFDNVNNRIYAGNTDYTTYGKIFVYTTNGTVVDSFSAGVAPGNIAMDIIDPSSIEESAATSLVAYPNPAADVLNIVNPFGNEVTVLTISDLSGRVVFSSNLEKGVNAVPVKDLAAGNYIATLQNEKALRIAKIAKL